MKKREMVFSIDDFGKNKKTNRNSLCLLKAKKVDRISIMPCREISEKEISELKRSGIKLDIHLEIPSIQKEDNFSLFPRIFSFLKNFFWSENQTLKIYKDWRKQIKRFEDKFERLPDGINSHEYVHFFPPYFKIALKLREEFQIPYIRFGRKGILKKNQNPKALILFFSSYFSKKIFLKKEGKISTSDYLLSWDWLTESEKKSFLSELPRKTEIIFHPEREAELLWLLQNAPSD